MLTPLTGILLLSSSAASADISPMEQCLGQDDLQRLACYDRLVEAQQKARLVAEAKIETTPSIKVTQVEAAAPIPVATILQSLWELGDNEKRGPFVVRTYQPNFLLPAHYTSSINRQPQSPTLGLADLQENYKPIEAKLQVSLRAKMLEDVLLPNADLWFAYTQTSMWQLWNSQDSAPFRSTDYQPEVIYVIPTAKYLGKLPLGWSMQMLQLGFVHQSNGQSEPMSRSWNRIYAAAAFERDQVGFSVKVNRRIPEQADDDDNPDLTSFLGTTELQLSWLPGSATASLTRKMSWNDFSNGSWQLDLTYPIDKSKADGLRVHLQLFSGYAETLLDYNHRQNSIGLGFMLFNF
ncbi:phospholipase A [Rheinheimera sp. UJ51]|uniref:phospholipase A n=1 Tax=Rheinheimera sp. UJ51 TaxID=2892446 RepID=UPI001E463550|nr:phospholipase A [Rheinheimera sp. UJ51]MCC5451763.1 phospholipase A [Rheinheimera sp. UJ51]